MAKSEFTQDSLGESFMFVWCPSCPISKDHISQDNLGSKGETGKGRLDLPTPLDSRRVGLPEES